MVVWGSCAESGLESGYSSNLLSSATPGRWRGLGGRLLSSRCMVGQGAGPAPRGCVARSQCQVLMSSAPPADTTGAGDSVELLDICSVMRAPYVVKTIQS